ncbi:MAG: hypothetical protein IT310_08190 [Anaerolineales bacterium]|nr:hypothetical protein [Anaerolineales bacterium]
MKAQIPQVERYSYTQHRKQVMRKIILPVVIATLLIIGLIVLICLATFNAGGDVGRWAAISTMWILIPVMIAGIIALALLIGVIYLLALALARLPHYTGLAQDYVYIARGYIVRGADALVKPVIGLNAWLENLKEFIGRMTP